MPQKLEAVSKGISGELEHISCTALGLESQIALIEHDLFSGEVTGV